MWTGEVSEDYAGPVLHGQGQGGRGVTDNLSTGGGRKQVSGSEEYKEAKRPDSVPGYVNSGSVKTS